MTAGHYALLTYGPHRSTWLTSVTRWSTSGALPARMTKCLSPAEVQHHLTALARHSAFLLEGRAPALDRVLVDAARAAGVPVIVLRSASADPAPWLAIGAHATVSEADSPAELLAALSTHAAAIDERPALAAPVDLDLELAAPGRLIAVCGPGGTGASTIAIALAQRAASDPLEHDLVVLADLARNAEQAVLHDAHDVGVGVEELVEAHRARRAGRDEVRALTSVVEARDYRLLTGVRRPANWTAMPSTAVGAAIVALRRAFRTVVVDMTADFEGASDSGSHDVEERNALARTSALEADVVVVVGVPGLKGIHAMARTIQSLQRLGVDVERIRPVLNRAPRNPLARRRAQVAIDALVDFDPLALTFVPERDIEGVHHEVAPLPRQLLDPLRPIDSAAREAPRSPIAEERAPSPIAPGSMGIAAD